MKGNKQSTTDLLKKKVKALTNVVQQLIKEVQMNASLAQGVLTAFQLHIGEEEWDKIVSFLTRAGLIALILNLTMMVIGFYVAKFFASGVPQQRAISLECGLQNGTLAVFVATQLFDNIIYMVPNAAYALVMMATSVIFVFILRKSN